MRFLKKIFRLRVVMLESFHQILGYQHILASDTNYDNYWELKKGGLGSLKALQLNDYQAFRAHWIEGFIQDGDSIIDVGCGDGAILRHLKGRKNIQTYALDSSAAAVKFLRDNGIEANQADITDYNSLAGIVQADHVLLLEVLEHLPDPESILKSLLLKTNKSIFFSFPNTGYFTYRLRLALGSFPIQWRSHPGEHLRFWTLKDLKWWLNELNLLDCSEIRPYQGLPILNRVFPNLFSSALIVRIDLQK